MKKTRSGRSIIVNSCSFSCCNKSKVWQLWLVTQSNARKPSSQHKRRERKNLQSVGCLHLSNGIVGTYEPLMFCQPPCTCSCHHHDQCNHHHGRQCHHHHGHDRRHAAWITDSPGMLALVPSLPSCMLMTMRTNVQSFPGLF